MTLSREEELASNLAHVEMEISEALKISGRSREEITLVAVTKNFPVEDVMTLYGLGVRDFGENRDQEGSLKRTSLPKDVRWHFQGQIQSRKIASILDWARVVHSLDSLDHAQKIAGRLHSQTATEEKHTFFLQVNFESEAQHRGGVQLSEVGLFLENTPVEISGLMVVPPLSRDPREIFRTTATLASKYSLPSLSMGMSGDFSVAIEEGATHIRVGSSILGSRPYLA
jgi:pyridoxal phosphate enzyme (YggS family)